MDQSEIDAFQTLFNVNLSKLSVPVLKAIDAAVRGELKTRRQENAVESGYQQDAVNAASKRFRGLSKPHHKYNDHWLGYLGQLLEQDWSHLFSGDPERKYYVYLHVSPNTKSIRFIHEKCRIKSNGLPFYVGKGCGNRAYDLNRNQGHGVILSQLQNKGYTGIEIVHIVKDKLTEAEAFELESKLIYFFGTRYEKGRKGMLVNLDIPLKPYMT